MLDREVVERLEGQAAKFGFIAAAGMPSRVPVDPAELNELLRVYRLWMEAQGGIVGDRIQYDDKSGGVEVDYWDGVPEVKKGDWVRLVRDGEPGEGS